MKLMKKFLLILLMLSLLAGCAAPVTTPEDEVATETPPEPVQPVEEVEEEEPYTSLDDFVLWDETGKLTLTGRGDTGANGVVASGKYEASKIGKMIMEQGGNAVDAAVAVGFALGLTEPNATGLGGGGFMTLRIAETDETLFINFRESAPAAATPDMWQTVLDDEGKETVIGNQKRLGGKAAGIPGFVAGLLHALDNYGTMSREEILAPTIELARKGFTVTPTFVNDLTNNYDSLTLYSESGDIFLKDVDGIKLPYELGDTFMNPDYAKTLEMIAKDGSDGFYKGEIAEAIVATVNKYGGLFTMEDMANYQVEVVEPVHATYRGYDIYSSPSPSSGGVIVGEILNIVENFDIGSMEFDSPERLHIFADTFAMAYADRGAYMGDTKFVDVPIKGLLSKDYAKILADKIQPDKAMENVMPDDPWMFEHEDTTHYSVADNEGNIVSVTSTVNFVFGGKVGIPGYGFVMNNEMDDFVVGPDHPNSIAGNKTPLSSMSPTIVMKDGKPFATLGSPGGTTIISTVAQVISNLVDYGMTMQEAVDAPRISGFRNSTISYEARFSEETIKALEAMGHIANKSDEFNRSFGSVNAVRYSPDGTLDGAGDPRRDGKALGF